LASGHSQFVELSAHPVLTQAVQSSASALQLSAASVGTLRREQGGVDRFLLSLAELYVQGQPLDLARSVGAGRKLSLPSYAFARQRYWLERNPTARSGDLSALGQASAEHPLLAASVTLAAGAGMLLTGRMSASSVRWLDAERRLASAAVIELVLAGAQRVGAFALERLVLEVPLQVPERGGLQLQLSVGEIDPAGARSVSLHARSETLGVDGAWTRHATGELSERADVKLTHGFEELRNWPPLGAAAVEIEPAAQAVRALLRDGETWYAELELPEEISQEAASFVLHPLLLEETLQLCLAAIGSDGRIELAGLRLHSTGARRLRARLLVRPDATLGLWLATDLGEPVLEIESLTLKADAPATRATGDALYGVDWLPLAEEPPAAPQGFTLVGAMPAERPALRVVLELNPPQAEYTDVASLQQALDAGGEPPECVVLICPHAADGGNVVASASRASHWLLGELQAWVSDARLGAVRLRVVTVSALAAAPGDGVENLALAPLWGL
jgi:acyl transferase domain-containing protein